MTDLTRFRHQPVRVLLVKLSSMGDIIHVTGAVRAIRQALPQAHITMVVEARWAALMRHNPHLNTLIESTPRDRVTPVYLAEMYRKLRPYQPFDIALDLQGNRRSAAWVYLSRAQSKLGRGSFRPGWEQVMVPDLRQHAVSVCAEICRSVGIDVANPDPELFTCDQDEQRLQQVLVQEKRLSGPYIVLNPFSRWFSKSWPIQSVAQIIPHLRKTVPYPLVLNGWEDDRERAQELLSLLGPNSVTSLVGQLTLGEALCLFKNAKLMVTCDSGPMHAAAAFGVPVVALFGPTHPERTGPWGPGHRVIQAIRPTTHNTYRSDPQGLHMQALEPETILDAIGSLTGEPPA